jgi:hypothetical protein
MASISIGRVWGWTLVAAAVGAAGLACQAGGRRSSSEPLPDVPDVRGNPATAGLQALLVGYGIVVDRAELDRECQVDGKGTDIDQLGRVARKHGLRATQLLMPAEHVLVQGAPTMPSLVIAVDDDGSVQFDVVWRRDGDRVEILDPQRGRRWVAARELLGRLYVHEARVPESQWTTLASNDRFQSPLRSRIASLGFSTPEVNDLMWSQGADESFGSHMAALDAAVRAMERRPPDASADRKTVLRALLACAKGRPCDGPESLDRSLFTANLGLVGQDGTPQAIVRGAVLLQVMGRPGAPFPLSIVVFMLALAWSLAIMWKMISALQAGRPYVYSFWDGGALRVGRVCGRGELKLKLALHLLLEVATSVTVLRVVNLKIGALFVVLLAVIDVAASFVTWRAGQAPPRPDHMV